MKNRLSRKLHYAGLWFVLALCISLSAALRLVSAANAVQILESVQLQGSLKLYVSGTGETGKSFQIGKVKTDVPKTASAAEESEKPRTLMILDNVQAIPEETGKKVLTLVRDIVSSHGDHELVRLASSGTNIQYLTEYTTDYLGIFHSVSNVKFDQADSDITNVLLTAVKDMSGDQYGGFSRILLISPGISSEEAVNIQYRLMQNSDVWKCPIDTVGIPGTQDSDAEKLHALNTIARMSGGNSYTYGENRTGDISASLQDQVANLTVYEVTIPVKCRDGSMQNTRLVLEDGTELTYEVRMPFLSTEDSLMKKFIKKVWPYLAVVTVLLVILIRLLIRRHMKKKHVREAKEESLATKTAGHSSSAPIKNNAATRSDRDSRTMSDSHSEYSCNRKEEELATTIVSRYSSMQGAFDKGIVLKLMDHANGKKFIQSLDRPIIIGRSRDRATVVVDYDKSVGRTQCRIFSDRGKVLLENLAEHNLTLLNDEPVQEPKELMDGDLLTMGYIKLQVEILRSYE